MTTIWRFDCPVHGEENGMYCFRAFEPANKHLWYKYQIVKAKIEVSEAERDEMLKKLT